MGGPLSGGSSLASVEEDEPVDGGYQDGSPDDVADGHRQQIGEQERLPCQAGNVDAAGGGEGRVEALDEQTDRNEVHIGDAVLESGGDEGGNRQDDGGDPVDRAAGAEGQPDRQTDQGIAQHAQRQRLNEAVVDLGGGRRQRRRPDRTPAEGVLARDEHQHHRADRPDEVAGVNDAPIAQQPARRHFATGPGHDDQVVPGKELGSPDDDQHQPDGEDQSGQQAHDAIGNYARGSGGHGRGEDRAERDESAGQQRQGERRQERRLGLANPQILRP